MERVPARDRDGRYLLLRAGLLLSVGRVAKAEADLAEAERADPKSGGASALRSVIALVRDQKDDALRLAETGAGLDPNSPLPQAALSYAHQGRFEIEKALEHAKRAVELAPEDALLWARVSELELSRGDLDAALEAAQKAETLSPALARTQTVLGFAYLTRIEVDKAKTAFERAIQGDPADPLPRLGMGLAKIRDGDLDEGTREIETAASLDPNNSLVRSYLGKAYYEQKRDGLASSEYEQAKLLDPKDPTPWFYDAIHKQTTNRPVEALHDLQKAIDLNDNRAVYRSKLLLDEDLAVRGTSLARIYDDLGFERLSLIESSNSLGLDPAEYAAHRFLSDTYAMFPRHEIARVSELLQTQLLQPVNIDPVQPQLNETDLNIVTGIGPAEAAFNEYTRLFEHDRPQLVVSGVAGNNATLGDEAVLSGLFRGLSYSIGQFHFESDGFRPRNDVEHNIYNVFAQMEVTPKINLQAEYRHRETTQGDLRRQLDPGFVPADDRALEQDTGRFGLHLKPAAQSDLIASLIYSDRRTTLAKDDPSRSVRQPQQQSGYDTQVQYLHRWDRLNVLLGGGLYEIEEDGTFRGVVKDPDFCAFLQSQGDIGPDCTQISASSGVVEQENIYTYTNIAIPSNLTWTLGVSFDSFDDEVRDLDLTQVNYKVGLQWDVTERIRLRSAAFKTLKRLLIVDQTIEPTQIAGFNQFFDDLNGTIAEVYGVGIDGVLSRGLFAGAEFNRRDVEEPSSAKFLERDEELYSGYVYWTPEDHWGLRAEFSFESIRGDPAVDPSELETQVVPIAARYFSPLGLFGEARATFVHQEVTPGVTETEESFTTIDAAVGYRLPKRRGIVSAEVTNLFDEEFVYQDLNFISSDQFRSERRFVPDRTFLFRLTLSF